jgi:hypothetical protein
MHDRCMPPRDIWDVNPVYQTDFYFSYCEWLASETRLGIYPLALVEESEVFVDAIGDEEELEGGSDSEYEYESIADSESDDEDDDVGLGFLLFNLDHLLYSQIGLAVLLHSGSADDPIDLSWIP